MDTFGGIFLTQTWVNEWALCIESSRMEVDFHSHLVTSFYTILCGMSVDAAWGKCSPEVTHDLGFWPLLELLGTALEAVWSKAAHPCFGSCWQIIYSSVDFIFTRDWSYQEPSKWVIHVTELGNSKPGISISLQASEDDKVSHTPIIATTVARLLLYSRTSCLAKDHLNCWPFTVTAGLASQLWITVLTLSSTLPASFTLFV